MGFTVSKVEKGSLGEELGLRKGDELLEINGERVVDLIDYQQLMCCEELTLTIREADSGDKAYIECDKDFDEPLGVEFKEDLMGPTRLCCNHCRFCFVDQLPKGMRKSLYVRDDDWRMSLMMGNYITLTNVNDRELERIIARHASPLYISVHVTEPNARADLMGQPRAALLMQQLKKLTEGGISFHAQAVLCPGINDGELLDRTVRELAAMSPDCITLALVPVGLTAHRKGLDAIRPYTKEEAEAILARVETWQEKFRRELGTAFVFASDEFYILAGRDVPENEAYEDYPQIDNGVGLVRFQREGCEEAYREFLESGKTAKPRRVAIITGMSACAEMEMLTQKYQIPGVDVKVYPVKNDFFGETVTVAGLVTGGDILRQLGRLSADEALIPKTMLRDGGNVFLDNVSLDEVSQGLGCRVIPVFTDGDELIRALAGEEI